MKISGNDKGIVHIPARINESTQYPWDQFPLTRYSLFYQRPICQKCGSGKYYSLPADKPWLFYHSWITLGVPHPVYGDHHDTFKPHHLWL
jgi:hypothetical protein